MQKVNVGGIAKGVGIGILVIGALSTIAGGMYTLEDGEFAVVRGASGSVDAVTEAGIHFKLPFVSTANFYNEYSTLCFDRKEDPSATYDGGAQKVTFSDTYSGNVNVCFRLQLPSDPDMLVEINGAVKNSRNLVHNTYKQNLVDLLAYTAPQFTGEAFMQGGQNEFRTRLEDQAKNGLYVTKRQAVQISREVAQAGIGNDNKKVTTGKSMQYRVIIQKDENGTPMRVDSQLAKLGINVVQVSFTSDFEPEPDLLAYMKKKKERIENRASIKENQETERQKAITAKLQGERERIQAKQQQLRAKDAAEIDAAKKIALEKAAAELELVQRQKMVDLAAKDRELAAEQKARELEMSQANAGIQKANYTAAKYEAQAIKEKGLAEAAVTKAKYAAFDKKLRTQELINEQTRYVAEAMQRTNVVMPSTVITGGQGGNNSLESLTNLTIIDKLAKPQSK